MLEKLFVRPCVLKRYLETPLLSERNRCLAHCAEAGSARTTLRLIASFQLVVMNYLELKKERRVTPDEVNANLGRLFPRL